MTDERSFMAEAVLKRGAKSCFQKSTAQDALKARSAI
jgi:hypothetical protein